MKRVLLFLLIQVLVGGLLVIPCTALPTNETTAISSECLVRTASLATSLEAFREQEGGGQLYPSTLEQASKYMGKVPSTALATLTEFSVEGLPIRVEYAVGPSCTSYILKASSPTGLIGTYSSGEGWVGVK